MRRSLKTTLKGVASALLLTTALFGRAASNTFEAARFRQLEGQGTRAARLITEEARAPSVVEEAWNSFVGQPPRDPFGSPVRREPAGQTVRAQNARGTALPSSGGFREAGSR